MLDCQEGPFCIFPTDLYVGDGGAAVITVEYLPSEIGLHEARVVMLQAGPNAVG